MKSMSIIVALGLSALTLPVLAQNTVPANPAATPGINQRIQNQDRRIEQGEKSGALTPREAERLEKREAKIKTDVAKAKADGVVTAQERHKINKELDQQSKAIKREKHDRQHDYNHDGKRDPK